MGNYYKNDAEILYTLLVKHIGISGRGSYIIAKQKNIKNGRHFYLDLMGHFLMESHDQTKNQCAKNKTSEATYSGGNCNWKIEGYYNNMSKAFHYLAQSGELN